MQPQTQPRSARARTPKRRANVYRAATNLAAFSYFSQEERERRWSLVREAMEHERLDCVVVPPSLSDPVAGATARYLTHVGGGGVAVSAVFPLAREPAAISTDAALWSAAQPWCTDLREARPSHAAAVLAKLREVPLRKRRVGIVGLGPDGSGGSVPVGFLRALVDALPRIMWVDFSGPIDRLRARKSPEELAFLRRSAAIVDAAYECILHEVRGGTREADLWAAAAETLCRLGSDLPLHIRWNGDSAVPTEGVFDGWLADVGVEAAWGGYRAAGRRPIGFGHIAPTDVALFDAAAAFWNEAFLAIRPGVPLAVLEGRLNGARTLPSEGRRGSVGGACRVVLRGCGLGVDPPRAQLRPSRDVEPEALLLPGHCFVLAAIVEDGARRLSWGETVAITARGVERLGSAPQRLHTPTP